tara:strand:- start:1822 stop:2502 length:681 start_codon:yes stop_codon:yes gene_type:complete
MYFPTPGLTVLNLENNLIRSDGAAAVAEALLFNGSLTHLNLNNNELCDQDVGGFNFVVNKNEHKNLIAVEAIAKLLTNRSTLLHLELECNFLGGQGAAVIAKALEDNTGLTTLNVANNRIGEGVGAQALGDALRVNCTLKYLNAAASNDFAIAGAELISQGLKSNRTLTNINLGGNPFAGLQNVALEGAVAISKAVAGNAGLKEVNLLGNMFAWPEDTDQPLCMKC